MSQHPKRAYVRFSGPMKPAPVNELITTVNSLAVESDEIHLDFRTDGGDIPEAYRLHAGLNQIPAELTMYNTSRVASSGIVPFLAGTTRIASAEAEFFYHRIAIGIDLPEPPEGATRGQMWFDRRQLVRWNERIRWDEAQYVQLHRKHTKLTQGTVIKLLNGEYTRHGRWAWEKGVVHRLGDFSPPPDVSVVELRFSSS